MVCSSCSVSGLPASISAYFSAAPSMRRAVTRVLSRCFMAVLVSPCIWSRIVTASLASCRPSRAGGGEKLPVPRRGIVDPDGVSALCDAELVCDGARHLEETLDHGIGQGVDLLQVRDVLPGNNENVNGSLAIYVFEGKHVANLEEI